MTSPQRCRLKHIERSVKIPSLILHLKREISEQIVNSFSIVEGIGAILVGVSHHISHSKSIDRHCREIDPTEDDDLTIGRQFCKTSNYPRITVLNNTADFSLNIDWRFSCIVSVQSGTHGDCWSAMLLDGWDCCCVVGELDLNASSFGDYVLSSECYQDFNVFLTNVEFVLRTNYLKCKIRNSSSQLQPSVVFSKSVGDGLGPPARSEGENLEGSINPWDGNGQFSDKRLKTDNGTIANFNSQPVNGGIDDAILVVRLLTVIDITWKRELRIQVNNPPVMLSKGPSGIRSYVEKLISFTNRSTSIEEDTTAINLISIGYAFCQHIEKHVIFCVVKLTFHVGGYWYCVYFQQEIHIDLLIVRIFYLCDEDFEFFTYCNCVKVDDLYPDMVVVGIWFAQFALKSFAWWRGHKTSSRLKVTWQDVAFREWGET